MDLKNPPPAPTRRMVSLSDLAAHLGVSPGTTSKWYREGRIDGVKLGPRLVRVDLDATLAKLGMGPVE
ncbi:MULTISPECIES: helix-turn-helix domain-containing protein [Actinomycetes]|uniref:helix-turn-helix transcriptional regulator n=1 Tax=Actinomycetes TaxID=1760 RepID=UPI0018CC0696|nr:MULTISPECIES: helix-turn-helix domain-containing protein [Actinomycetes]